MAYPLQNSNSGGAHVSILETFSRFDAHLGASGGFWCGSWVVLGWCWVLCAGSWVPFLRFPLWEFHVKAICFHVRVSFDKTSQLLRRSGIRSSEMNITIRRKIPIRDKISGARRRRAPSRPPVGRRRRPSARPPVGRGSESARRGH